MFTTQFGLYEQVKQSQLEMEWSAQRDLEVFMANQDSPSLPDRLGSLLAKWGSHIQHGLGEKLTGFAVNPKNIHKAA